MKTRGMGRVEQKYEKELYIEEPGKRGDERWLRPDVPALSEGINAVELYALASSFSNAFPFRNHDRSRLCMYRGNVRFLASNFCAHSRDSSHRFAIFRKLA